jgi:predicted nucleic acid-binding protein
MNTRIQRLSFVIADHSIVAKFLQANCIDLLSAYADRVIVTDHVRHQLTEGEQCSRFHAALSAGKINEEPVENMEELSLFARLGATNRLGVGEQAAVAVACVRRCELAIDANQALTKAIVDAGLRQQHPTIRGSRDILDALVRRGRLDERAASLVLLTFAASKPPPGLVMPSVRRTWGKPA